MPSPPPPKHIPIEIVMDILLRLPPKTLVRCMSVCKTWYSLIKNPNFISTHLNHSASNGKGFLLYLPLDYSIEKSFTLLCDKTFDEVSNLEVPIEPQYWSCAIVGSFNGLLCLTNNAAPGHTIYLCNPATKKCKTTRSSSIVTNWSRHISVHLGFGYHHLSNDYKVVRTLSFLDEGYDERRPEVEVYSLSTDSWKKIEYDFHWITRVEFSTAVVNGCLHSIAYDADVSVNDLILSFDVGLEVFREIMLPDPYVSRANLDVSVGVFNESLSLFFYGCSESIGGGERCCLWVMREYGVAESWTKQFEIVVNGGVRRTQCFTKQYEIILQDNYREIVLYDSKNQQIKNLGLRLDGLDINLVTYMESLVLLEGGNELLGQERSFKRVIHKDIHTPVREKDEMPSQAKHLPIKIVTDILLRLSTETIVRCMSVCKTWYSLIKNPYFISTHLNNSASNGKAYLLYLPLDYKRKKSFTLLCEKTFDEVLELEVPIKPQIWCCTLVGSFHGLICLTDDDAPGRTIYLCNPAIQKCKTTCSSSIITNWSPEISIDVGFGYHHLSNDYKVIRIWYFEEGFDERRPEVEVYTLSTDTWKKIEFGFHWVTRVVFSTALVNESLHWIAMNGDVSVNDLILSFDIGLEVFQEIMLPDPYVSRANLEVSLGVFNESLSLFFYGCSESIGGGEQCCLWVMREYGMAESWTKQFEIVVNGGVRRTLCFTKQDEIILRDNYGNIVLYDSKNKQIKYLGLCVGDLGLKLVTYMESLVLLEGRNELPGEEKSFKRIVQEDIRTPVREKDESADGHKSVNEDKVPWFRDYWR